MHSASDKHSLAFARYALSAAIGNFLLTVPSRPNELGDMNRFALPQIQSHRTGSGLDMATRVFLCPHTGQRVQGWFADDGSEDASGETYEGVSCLACNQLHMVNRRTGKVLGADEE